MKVLQVTHRYPPQTGGIETHVKEVSERLVTRGHDVTVFSSDAGEHGSRREHRNGVRIRRFRALTRNGAFYVAPGIGLAVRRNSAAIVHVHNYHALPALFATVGLDGKPVVFTTHYHGTSESPLRDRLLSLYEPLGRRIVDRADTVIAVSDWEREQLRRDFSIESSVIPNGIDFEQFADAIPDERETRYLLCVGRLEKYKGIQYAIRALPELRDYHLVVVGSGPYRDRLEDVARTTGVRDRVEFLGYVTDDDLPGLYAGADAYLALSEFEAYGLTVKESLAAGTPCVVRETGALGEWAERADCVGLDSPTPASIAEAVRAVIDREPSTRGLRSWSDVVDGVEAEYNSVLSARSGE